MSEERSDFTIAYLKRKAEELHAAKMDNELCRHIFVFTMAILASIILLP